MKLFELIGEVEALVIDHRDLESAKAVLTEHRDIVPQSIFKVINDVLFEVSIKRAVQKKQNDKVTEKEQARAAFRKLFKEETCLN